MAKTAAILDVLVKAETARASLELRKFDRNLQKTARTAEATDKQILKTEKSTSSFGSSITDTNQRVTYFKNAIGTIKWPAMIAGAGAASQAVAALGAGVGGLASALAPLSGLLAAYPALLGAMGQAAGVKALAGFEDLTGAVGGLNEKLDETSEEFKALSPQAQKFARTLQDAKAPLLDLQGAVQGPLFGGLEEGLEAAMKNLPRLKQVMVDTADVMGDLAAQAGRFVGREGFGRDFAAVGSSNAELLRRMGQAGLNLADALRHVMVTARPLIDFLGRGAVGVSNFIEALAKSGRESGNMAAFFERTEKVVRQLVSIGGSLASVFLDIGAAARPLGEDIMKVLVDQAEKLAQWTSSNQGALRQYFEDARAPLEQAGRLVKDLVRGFFEISKTPGLAGFIKQFRLELLPAIIDMTTATTKQFGPKLIDFLTQGAKLLTNFVGSSGPLTIFVQGFTTVFRTLNKLIETIPGLGTVLATTLGGLSVMKLLGFSDLRKGAFVAIGKKIAVWLGVGAAASGAASAAGAAAVGGGAAGAGTKGATSGLMKSLLGGAAGAGGTGAAVAASKFMGQIGNALKVAAKGVPIVGAGISLGMTFWDGFATQSKLESEDIRERLQGQLDKMGDVPILEAITGGTDTAQQKARIEEIVGVVDELAKKGKSLPVDQFKRFRQEINAMAIDPEFKADLRAVLKDASAGSRQVEQDAQAYAKSFKKGFNLSETARTFKAAINGINANYGKGSAEAQQISQRTYTAMTQHVAQMVKKGKIDIDQARHFLKQFGGDIRDLGPEFKPMSDKAINAFHGVNKGAERELGGAANKGKKASKDLADGVLGNVDRMVTGVGKGLETNKNNVNKALKGFGVKKQTYVAFEAERANLGGNQRGGIIHALRGTLVPGKGTGDTVPAMLEPGEVVINKRAVAAAGGSKRVNAINSMIPRFAEGGSVGLVQALGPYDIPPIQYDENHAGGNSHLHLSFDSVAHAKSLANAIKPLGWTASESPWAGGLTVDHQDPGHYTGSAFDANAADESHGAVAKVAKILGGAGVTGAAAVKLAKMVLKGPDGPLKEIGQSALDKAVAGGQEMIDRLAPKTTGGNSLLTGSGDVEKVFASTAKKLSTSKTATLALGMAGYAESGMQDLPGGMDSSQGALQLLASTAAGMGIDPHDEAAIASAFLLRGYYGRGGANKLAAQGLPAHLVAQGVQGSAFSSGSNYAAQAGPAKAWMGRYGLQMGGVVQKLQNGGEVEATFGEATAVKPGDDNTGQISIGGAHGLGAGDVKGHGGESPDTPLGKWFSQMVAPDPIKRMTDIIGGIGLRGDRMTKWGEGYTAALDYDEFATMANSATFDDSITNVTHYGLAGPGMLPAISGLGGETGWLNLELIQLFNVREQMVAALPVLDSLSTYVKDKIDQMAHWRKIAHKILDSAKKAEGQLKRKISHLEGQLKKLEQQLGDAKGDAADNLRTRIHDLKDRIGELKDKLPNAAVAVSNATVRTDAVDKIKDAFGAKGTELAGFKTSILTGGAEDGSWPSLETLQGRVRNYSVLGELPGLGTLGGDIFRVQLEIRDALTTAQQNADIGLEEPPTETDAGTVFDSSDTAALAAQLAQQQANVAALLAEQAPVFAGFFKQLSATPVFHEGGITPGGMVNTLPGEGIFTQEQMAALGPSNVEVNVSFDGFDVVVDTYVNDVLAKQTRKALTRGPTVGRRTS